MNTKQIPRSVLIAGLMLLLASIACMCPFWSGPVATPTPAATPTPKPVVPTPKPTSTPAPTPTVVPPPPSVGVLDDVEDGVSCADFLPIDAELLPVGDVGKVTVQLIGDTYYMSVQFPRIDDLEESVKDPNTHFWGGGIGVYSNTQPLLTYPGWKPNELAQQGISITWDPEYQFESWRSQVVGDEWVYDEHPAYPVPVHGNTLTVTIPADDLMPGGRGYVFVATVEETAEEPVCDVTGLDANGVPAIEYPPFTPLVVTETATISAALSLDGVYLITNTVKSDAEPPHEEHVDLPENMEVQVLTGTGTITFTGDGTFVDVVGTFDEFHNFEAEGVGIVANIPNIKVEMSGAFTRTTDSVGFTSVYTMGADGGLPGGDDIVFSTKGVKLIPVGSKSESGTGEETVYEFTDQWVDAIQTGDTSFLLARLHPELLKIYGSDQCEDYFLRVTDPTLELEVLNVGDLQSWTWERDGRSVYVPSAYEVDVNLSTQTYVTTTVAHYAPNERGLLLWFSDCGDPR